MLWGWVHSLHILCAAVWIGSMFADRVVVAPLLRRLDLAQQRSVLPGILKANSAVGWASVTFLTVTGLALTFHWVPIERYESPYGRLFVAKLIVVMVLFLVFVMFYSARQQRLKVELAQGVAAEEGIVDPAERLALHLRRLGLYTTLDLVLIELAIYA